MEIYRVVTVYSIARTAGLEIKRVSDNQTMTEPVWLADFGGNYKLAKESLISNSPEYFPIVNR